MKTIKDIQQNGLHKPQREVVTVLKKLQLYPKSIEYIKFTDQDMKKMVKSASQTMIGYADAPVKHAIPIKDSITFDEINGKPRVNPLFRKIQLNKLMDNYF